LRAQIGIGHGGAFRLWVIRRIAVHPPVHPVIARW
jgi:hypothetical protein